MQRNLRNIIIVIILLMLAISPVAAQDTIEIDSPEAITVTIPGDGDSEGGRILPYEFIGLIGLVALAFLYAAYVDNSNRKLHLEAIDRLFKSTPPVVRDPAFGFVSGLGDNILTGLDLLADATHWTDLDDRAQEQIAAYWQEAKDRWSELRQGIVSQVAQSRPTDWTPENAIAYLQARNYQVVQQSPGNWQAESGVWTPGSESMQPGRASYLSDETDGDFTDEPPKG